MKTITDENLIAVASEIFEPILAKLSPRERKKFDEFAKKEYLNRTIMKVKFKKLLERARLPEKATEGSAAYDLYVAEDILIKPGRQIIPLGFAMEMEQGHEALIDPRSGFSSKGMEGYIIVELTCVGKRLEDCYTENFVSMKPHRLDCDVIEGKIDADYRDGVGVIVHSHEVDAFLIKAGTRIAQMTFHKVETVQWEEADELSETNREGGFGSTGTK